MTQNQDVNATDAGAEAPSSMTLAQLLNLLTLGGRLTLRVGDPVSTTTLTATTDPSPSLVSGLSAPPPAGGLPPPSSGPTTTGGDGLAAATAASVPATLSCATKPVLPCQSCATAGCLPPLDAGGAQEADPVRPNPVGPIEISDSESESEDVQDEPGTRWYVVTKGRQVGVYAHWHVVAPLVVSVSGACYARYATRNIAIATFARALNDGNVSIIA